MKLEYDFRIFDPRHIKPYPQEDVLVLLGGALWTYSWYQGDGQWFITNGVVGDDQIAYWAKQPPIPMEGINYNVESPNED